MKKRNESTSKPKDPSEKKSKKSEPVFILWDPRSVRGRQDPFWILNPNRLLLPTVYDLVPLLPSENPLPYRKTRYADPNKGEFLDKNGKYLSPQELLILSRKFVVIHKRSEVKKRSQKRQPGPGRARTNKMYNQAYSVFLSYIKKRYEQKEALRLVREQSPLVKRALKDLKGDQRAIRLRQIREAVLGYLAQDSENISPSTVQEKSLKPAKARTSKQKTKVK